MKEFSILEKWKYTPTEEILEIRGRAKKAILLNTEWVLFVIFMTISIIPSVNFFFKSFLHGITAMTLNLLFFTPLWFFHLRKKYVSQERTLEAEEVLSEMDIVLKNRD